MSEQWMQTCEAINVHIHLPKVWGILRWLLGQCKSTNWETRVALREGISAVELAERAAKVFFSQTSTAPKTTYARGYWQKDNEACNNLFTVAELEHTLQHANTRSTLVADQISVAHLRKPR